MIMKAETDQPPPPHVFGLPLKEGKHASRGATYAIQIAISGTL